MTEQLITFETAKLAKEKGFDWLYPAYYYNRIIKNKLFDGVTNTSSYSDINNRVNGDVRYTAPSQSLLQKWLREKGVHILITHHSNQPVDNVIWKDCYQVFVQEIAHHPYYSTYEEALEVALRFALKFL